MNKFRHSGVQITLDADGMFSATINDFEHKESTLIAATTWIDAYKQRKAKEHKLDLQIMDGEGTPGIITGIHLGTGSMTIIGNLQQGRWNRQLFPLLTWIGNIIEEKRRLNQRIQGIEDTLKTLALEPHYAPYGRIDGDIYAESLRKLEDDYNAKMQLALAGEHLKEVILNE